MTPSTAPADAPPPQALVCSRLADDLSGLALAPWPPAAPGAGEVRLAVRAAALNFPDWLMTRGDYQHKPALPFVPGMEGAGIVLEAGAASGWTAGERVSFSGRDGALAQQVVLPGSALRPLPAGLDFAEGAAYLASGVTAWVALQRLGRLQRGETLLVHGARGGVGWACVQLGLHLGARVLATASQPERLGALAALGATVLPAAGFRDAVLAATDGRGADVIADPVGGDVFDESQRCVAFGGRVLVLGFASGRIPTLAMNRPLIKGYALIGVRAGEYGRRLPAQGRDDRAAVSRLAAAGVLKPHIGARFALADAVAALDALRQRRVLGKIVVEMP